MNYIVQTKKLKSLINPFEQKINGLKITIEEVKEALSNNNIVANSEESELKQFISKVAFKVANYQREELQIELPESSDIEFNSAEILKEGLVGLTAAIFKGEEDIIANITGNSKIIKTLLGVDLSKPDNVVIQDEEKFELLDWDAHIEAIKEDKIEEDYVEKAYNLIGEKTFVKENFLKEVPVENWENKEFIFKMLQADSDLIENLSPEIVLTEPFLEVVKDDIENFEKVFSRYFVKKMLFDLKKEDVLAKLNNSIYLEPDAEGMVEDLKDIDIEEGDVKDIYLDKKFLSYDVIAPKKTTYNKALVYIKEHIFNNVGMGLALLENENCDFYQFLSEEVKFNPLVLEKIFDGRKKKTPGTYYYTPSVESFISQERGEDIVWMKSFLKEYGQHIDYYDFKANKKIYSNWIKDKNTIVQLFSMQMSEKVANLFELIPPKIKNNSEILDVAMVNCPNVYPYLNEANQKKYLIHLIKNGNDLSEINIKNEFIYELTDKKHFLTLLSKNKQYWLEENKCPKHLSEDPDLFFHNNVNFMRLLDNKKVVKSVMKSDEYISQAISRAKNFYSMLPYEKQLDIDFALLNLNVNIAESNSYNKPFHSHLLNSKKFCLEAITIDKSIVKDIAPSLWNDKEFLIGVCRAMDQYKGLENTILLEGNSKLMTLFESYKVTSQYENFLTSYISQTNLNNKIKNKETTIKKKKV